MDKPFWDTRATVAEIISALKNMPQDYLFCVPGLMYDGANFTVNDEMKSVILKKEDKNED